MNQPTVGSRKFARGWSGNSGSSGTLIAACRQSIPEVLPLRPHCARVPAGLPVGALVRPLNVVLAEPLLFMTTVGVGGVCSVTPARDGAGSHRRIALPMLRS